LRELVAEGHSASEIAADLNALALRHCTRCAVIGKIHRLGLREAWGRRQGARPKPAPRPRRPRPRKVVAANGAQPAVAKVRSKVRLPPTPEPVPQPPDHLQARHGLLALGHGDCRWPYSDPRAADFRFCGKPALPDRPYCAAHERRAHARG
jgi:GcrA cell cycle regulator